MLNFTGKIALVTGASSGIGRELASALVRRGSRVIAVARRADRLATLQAELGTQNLECVVADLYQNADQERVAALIEARSIDIVVNNAGRGSFGQFDKLDLASELQMVELNVSAFLKISHAALAVFRKRGSGALLGVSSIAAFQPLPFLATYAATKAFEYHLYRALRAEVAGTGIIITSLNPGPVATEFAGVARVPGTVTGFNRDQAQMVAKQALDALARNQAFIVPGFVSYITALASRMLPTSITTFATASSLRRVLEKIEHP